MGAYIPAAERCTSSALAAFIENRVIRSAKFKSDGGMGRITDTDACAMLVTDQQGRTFRVVVNRYDVGA